MPYSVTNAKLHFLFGNLSRADVRLNTANKKPYVDWFDKNQDYLISCSKLPKYGFLYFHLLYAMSKQLGDIGKMIQNVETEDDVDKILAIKIRT